MKKDPTTSLVLSVVCIVTVGVEKVVLLKPKRLGIIA
jgi:hypothetical protein